MDALFGLYDRDRSGCLDYKEFTYSIFGGGNASQSSGPKQMSSARSTAPAGTSTEELLERLRTKLASRGARGIIGLGKQFRIMDDNNSRSLDLYEFTKAMKDYMLGFSDSEIRSLYAYFDYDRSGTVDYDEFLRSIRGPLGPARRKLVGQAYGKLDRDGNGWIDINDIKGVYSAKTHPDVLQGKKSEEQILLEFLETFETHHSLRNNGAPDHVVTKEEFEEYYSNISASIDDDRYFELMMNNAWKINDGDRTYGKAWTNKDTQGNLSARGGAANGSQSHRSSAAGGAAVAQQRPSTSQGSYSRPQSSSGRGAGGGSQQQQNTSSYNIGFGGPQTRAQPQQQQQ